MDNSLIISLHAARLERVKVKAAMKEALALVTGTPEYKSLEANLSDAIQDESDALVAVQLAALDEFGKDGNKHPHEAVTVKEYPIVEIIDENKAREWCFAAFHPGLVLDTKAFIDLAKLHKAPEEYVKEYVENRVSVATDLSKYVVV